MGGTIKKQENQLKNELTKLKVYGLDAFQVRAEEEMKQIHKRKENWLARRFKAHDPTSTTRR